MATDTLITGTRRRTLLGGLAVLTAAPMPALAAPAADPDAELMALAAELTRATQATEEACRAQDQATDGPAEKAAEAATLAAHDAWEAIVSRMAGIPAASLVGVAVKAQVICRACEGSCGGRVEEKLAKSLEADIRRLVPAAAII